MTPTVSVVIPTYNNGHLIREALDSVISQTFRDHEIVVIDDGSTDDTRAVLSDYDGRIRYHYQENQGLAVARNVGLQLARGRYVTYLDADDVWFPRNLEIKAEVLGRFPDLGGVFSEFCIFDAQGVRHPRGTKELFPFFQRTGRDFKDIFPHTDSLERSDGHALTVYRGQVFDQLFLGNFILPSSMVFNRAFALEVGEFRPHLRTQQDYEYWLRYSRRHPLAFVDEVLVKYRRHSQQLTDHSRIERILAAVAEIIDRYEEEFLREGKQRLFNRRKAEILVNQAKVNVRQGKAAQARSLMREAMRRSPGFLPTYFHYVLSAIPYRWSAKVRSLLRS